MDKPLVPDISSLEVLHRADLVKKYPASSLALTLLEMAELGVSVLISRLPSLNLLFASSNFSFPNMPAKMETRSSKGPGQALTINAQSKAQEKLLNVIDHLRSQGVSRYINLPQLIVCGDQSSGKSSVLEAVSSLKFPTKDALCTRFATELILRRNPEITSTVTRMGSMLLWGLRYSSIYMAIP